MARGPSALQRPLQEPSGHRPGVGAFWTPAVSPPRALQHRAAAPGLRYGQTFFNLLHAERPDLADELRGSEIDPFHFDTTRPGLLDWVERNWYERVDSPVKR